MVQELLEIRSEKPSLSSLEQTLGALRDSKDINEMATLLMMVTEFYSDSQCICEELSASYGEESEEAKACQLGVNKGREAIFETYKKIITDLRGK